MGAAAKTGGGGRKLPINKKPASSSSATASTTAAKKAKAAGSKGGKAAQLESKLAKLAGAGQEAEAHQHEMGPPVVMENSDAASAASEGEGAPEAGVDPSTSADFVALSSAVQGKLAAGKGKKQQGQQGQAQQSPKAGKGVKGEKGGDPVKAAARQGRILYLGHVPHGFFEEQMRAFFAQFGEVARLRLSRSKKTAKSRGYAFIEFADKEVARIVAETMDGYYLSGRKLVCHALEPAKAHPGLFDDADKTWRVIPWRRLERERREAPKTEADARKCLSRLLRGDGKRRRALSKRGIDYEFAGYAAEAHLAAVKRKKDDPEAGTKTKATQEQAQLPASAAASKKRGRKEGEGEEQGEGKAAAAARVATAKAGGSKKAKVGEAAEQRKALAATAAAAAVSSSKKRARAGSEEAEGAPKAKAKAAAGGKKAPVKKTAAGAKKGAKGK